MRRTLAVLVAVCGGVMAVAEPARGQIMIGPGGVAGGFRNGFSFSVGGGGFSVGGPRFSLNGGYGPGPGPGYYAPPPYRPYAPGYAPPQPIVVVSAPQIVAPPPPSALSVIQGMFPPSQDAGQLARRPAPAAPAVNRADFKVIQPQPAVAKRPAQPANPAVPNAGAVRFPDPGPVPKDPKQAAVFQVSAARTAFAADEYGRAGERLAEAIAADPADPLTYFLLAQVKTARGEYAEAVAAIRDGMKRAPDWPASGFRIRELYGKNPRRFDEHLVELRKASDGKPDDATLAFLLGYHLWFLGERGDAAKLFRKAAGKVKDGGVIDRFLAEADGKDA